MQVLGQLSLDFKRTQDSVSAWVSIGLSDPKHVTTGLLQSLAHWPRRGGAVGGLGHDWGCLRMRASLAQCPLNASPRLLHPQM